MQWRYDDGGAQAAGAKKSWGDCVVRACAIATEEPYMDIVAEMRVICKEWVGRSKLAQRIRADAERLPRKGVFTEVADVFLRRRGFTRSTLRRQLDHPDFAVGVTVCKTVRHFTVVKDGVCLDRLDITETPTIINEYDEVIPPRVRTAFSSWRRSWK